MHPQNKQKSAASTRLDLAARVIIVLRRMRCRARSISLGGENVRADVRIVEYTVVLFCSSVRRSTLTFLLGQFVDEGQTHVSGYPKNVTVVRTMYNISIHQYRDPLNDTLQYRKRAKLLL